MSYIGSTRRPFKSRLYEYRTSTPKSKKKKPTNCTQLTNYQWKLYKKDEKYTIKWKINRQTNSKFKPNFMCSLYNLERLYIANANKIKILNKRNKLITQCPHYPKEYFQFIFGVLFYLITFTQFIQFNLLLCSIYFCIVYMFLS